MGGGGDGRELQAFVGVVRVEIAGQRVWRHEGPQDGRSGREEHGQSGPRHSTCGVEGMAGGSVRGFLDGARTACTGRLPTRALLFGKGTCLVWHIHDLELRLRAEKMPNMASLWLTWRHLVPGQVACMQCARGAETPPSAPSAVVCCVRMSCGRSWIPRSAGHSNCFCQSPEKIHCGVYLNRQGPWHRLVEEGPGSEACY